MNFSVKHTLKTTAIFILSALLVLSAVSCGDEDERFPTAEGDGDTVMTAGKFDVPLEVYRYFALNYRTQYEDGETIGANDPEADELAAYVDEYTAQSLKNCYGTLALAEEYDMSIDDKAVQDALDINMENYVTEYGGDESYISTLAESNLTNNVFRFVMGVQILQENIYYYMLEKDIIPDSDEVVNEKLRGDGFVRVKQILIKNDEGDDKLENMELANRVLQKAKAGEDFDALISEYGEDMNMFMNTDGYYFTRHEMLEEFENAAFALETGEISNIIETPLGYSIILRLEKEESYIAANFEKLREQYLVAEYNKLLDEYCAAVELAPVEGVVIPDIFTLQ